MGTRDLPEPTPSTLDIRAERELDQQLEAAGFERALETAIADVDVTGSGLLAQILDENRS
jgi:hypothetical protein